MEKYHSLSVMLLLSFMVLFAGCGNKENDAKAKPASDTERAAKVVSVSGKVAVIKSDGKAMPAFEGMSLNQSDKIKTEENSTLVLEIGEDKQLKISQNTELTMSLLQASKDSGTEITKLDLGEGVVWINIKDKLSPGSKFEIETPTAVMGVRGTIFSVLHSDNTSRLSVIDGSVTATRMVEVKNADETTTKKEIAAVVGKGMQVKIDDTVKSEEDFNIQPISLESLDPFTLENVKELIKTQPDDVDDTLKEELNSPAGGNQEKQNNDENTSQKDNDEEGNAESNGGGDNKSEMQVPDFASLGALMAASGGEAKLPDGYPSDLVPIIGGARVFFSMSESDVLVVGLEVGKTYEDVKNYYSGVMKGAEEYFEQEKDGAYIIGGIKSGNGIAVIIMPKGIFNQNGTGVVISMTPN